MKNNKLPLIIMLLGSMSFISANFLRADNDINWKLMEIKIPHVYFDDATIQEAIDKLRSISRELDVKEADPAKKGINIILKLPPASEKIRFSMDFTDTPLGIVLNAISAAGSLKIRVYPDVVMIVPAAEPDRLISKNGKQEAARDFIISAEELKGDKEGASTDFKRAEELKAKIANNPSKEVSSPPLNSERLITRAYKVPPAFFSTSSSVILPSKSGGVEAVDIKFQLPKKSGAVDVQDFFRERGVMFTTGTTAIYIASNNALVIKNTKSNFDIIDSIVDNYLKSVKGAAIDLK